MGTSERLERERHAKRALILDAARDLFLERGYDAVTLRQIAERIEHSTTAIYVHFADKFDLFQQLVHDDFRRFDDALTAHAHVVDPVERLQRIGRAYVEFAMTMPRSYEMMFMRPMGASDAGKASPEAEADAQPGKAAYTTLVTTCVELLAQGRLRPDLTDPLAVAQAVWSGVHGLVTLQMRCEHAPELQWRSREDVLSVLMTMICQGILRSPPPDIGTGGAQRA